MQIHVLYFAFFRERLGMKNETIEVPSGATVTDALDALGTRHDIIANTRGAFRVAVNQDMVPEDTVLQDGDEMALIPPVAGGSDRRTRHACIVDAPLSLDRVVAAVSGPGMGGIVTFTGQVRDTNLGHKVVRLEYEAYADMANKVFTALCEEIEGEHPGTRLAIEHRVGVLEIGECAVVIAAAAPHRDAAFSACRTLIDRLKEEAPIWKKEVDPSGAEWIGMGP